MTDYTKEYYELNSDEFIEGTMKCNMQNQYDFFEKFLKPSSKLLDLGFGSGRDMLYFKDKGYIVSGLDYSEKFCEHARELGFSDIYCGSILDVEMNDRYDGIWACASLLHIERKDLVDALKRCRNLLEDDGYMYVSFKYGDFEGERNGRFFTFMNESLFEEYYNKAGFELADTLITEDVRKDRDEKWLNVILKKK